MSETNVEVAALGYFIKQGLSPAQAAGIVGNLKQESSLNPKAPGGGLAQWLGSRLANLHSFAASKGASPESAGTQIEFIWHELTTSEQGTLANLKRAKTPQEAARIFSQQYERPSEPNLPARERYAVEAYKTAAKGQGAGLPGENIFKGIGKTLGAPIVGAFEAGKTAGGVVKDLGGVSTLANTVIGWTREPLTPVKFIGGAVLLYIGVRTLTGGSGAARETNRAVSHARELAAIVPK